MNKYEFEQLLEEDFKIIQDTLCQKTVEYAGDDNGPRDGRTVGVGGAVGDTDGDVDYLSCFKHAGEIAGISPVEALRGFMLKHTTSIYDMLKDPRAYTMEKWDEKIFDHINYLILLRALLMEGRTRASWGTEAEASEESREAEACESCEDCEGYEESEDYLRYLHGDASLKKYIDQLHELLRETDYNNQKEEDRENR